MILKNENNKIIRTIEYRDRNEILSMFQKEDFGLVGLLADQRPSLYEEAKVIDYVLNKELLAEEYIILEIEGIIVTYACVYQDGIDRIHIGSIVTKKEYRHHGYGSYLLEFIKEYADQNNLIIRTESLTCGSLLQKLGFDYRKSLIEFMYTPKKSIEPKRYPIFLDYERNREIQEKLTKEREEKDLENYSKCLDILKDLGFF